MRSVTLIILDGFGIGEAAASNPIFAAATPTLKSLFEKYPSTALQASGIAVGLPWGEEGNSEVGHLTLGAGMVIFQHLPRITLAIRSGEFFSLAPLLSAAEFLRRTNGRLHLFGMLSSGSVHSHREHLEGLLTFAEKAGLEKVLLHIVFDGRDAPKHEGLNLAAELEKRIASHPAWRIASLSGRFYTMDKDGRWDRVEPVARMIAEGKAKTSTLAQSVFDDHYGRGLSDEFIEPTILSPRFGAETGQLASGDVLLFWNFREDGMEEVSRALTDPSFSEFSRSIPDNVRFVFMTQYAPSIAGEVLFPPLFVSHPIGRILADAGRRQLRIAEQEKSAHVTTFFNGLEAQPFDQEYRILLPSPPTPRPDMHPEMNAHEVGLRLIEAEREGVYDFILVNFANPDIVAHSGDFDATRRAIEVIDGVLKDVFSHSYPERVRIITSDHGNAERVRHPLTGVPEPQHDTSPVPFLLVSDEFLGSRARGGKFVGEREIGGILADVAPTILELMGIPKPSTITGRNLLSLLR